MDNLLRLLGYGPVTLVIVDQGQTLALCNHWGQAKIDMARAIPKSSRIIDQMADRLLTDRPEAVRKAGPMVPAEFSPDAYDRSGLDAFINAPVKTIPPGAWTGVNVIPHPPGGKG